MHSSHHPFTRVPEAFRAMLFAGSLLLAAFAPGRVHAQNAALSASFQVASSGDSGYSATVVVTNNGGALAG